MRPPKLQKGIWQSFKAELARREFDVVLCAGLLSRAFLHG